ncbi:MAG: IS3 family transposase [Pseudomonadota bacterium]
MSGQIRYSDEFKIDAVAQVTERGYSVKEVAERLGISTKSLYTWMPQFSKPQRQSDQEVEVRRLKKELARVTEEREILKKANRVLRQGCKVRYAFIDAHRQQHPVRVLCKILSVHPSGFYAWVKEPLGHRALEDARQTKMVKKAWKDSGKVYGYRKIYDDLIDMGETASENRVARLARLAGIQAQIGYKKKPGVYGGKPSVVVDNTLGRQFAVDTPDRAWVTDITYLRTHEGFAYLCVVIDLFSRRVVGWAVQSRQTSELAVQALLMAIWRRKPGPGLLIHSDQGAQFTSREWAAFLREHNLEHAMSRRGNCHDNAVAESFFQLLKREKVRRRKYWTREEARRDIFEYIELFYNPKRKHTNNGTLSPVDFEERQPRLEKAGV